MRKQQGKIKSPSEATRHRRKLKIRKTVNGTAERPRICTNKTNKHIFVQVIDDASGKTMFSVQTFGKHAVQGASGNVEGGKLVGAKVAELLKEKKIENAVYDRNGFRYTGVIASVASSIRENGIQV